MGKIKNKIQMIHLTFHITKHYYNKNVCKNAYTLKTIIIDKKN